MQETKAAPTYIFEQHDAEYRRLARQAEYLRALTRGAMVRAGVQPGMRVLDFGAGSGEVSVLAVEPLR